MRSERWRDRLNEMEKRKCAYLRAYVPRVRKRIFHANEMKIINKYVRVLSKCNDNAAYDICVMIERARAHARERERDMIADIRYGEERPEEVTEMYRWEDREGKREKDGLGSTRDIERDVKRIEREQRWRRRWRWRRQRRWWRWQNVDVEG